MNRWGSTRRRCLATIRRSLSLTLGGLVVLAAAAGIGRFVYTPLLPMMVEDLAMTKDMAGLLASADFLGYLTGALLIIVGSAPAS